MEDVKSQFYRSFDERTSFRAKGLPLKMLNRDFTSAFDARTFFRAKGLHFMAPR